MLMLLHWHICDFAIHVILIIRVQIFHHRSDVFHLSWDFIDVFAWKLAPTVQFSLLGNVFDVRFFFLVFVCVVPPRFHFTHFFSLHPFDECVIFIFISKFWCCALIASKVLFYFKHCCCNSQTSPR